MRLRLILLGAIIALFTACSPAPARMPDVSIATVRETSAAIPLPSVFSFAPGFTRTTIDDDLDDDIDRILQQEIRNALEGRGHAFTPVCPTTGYYLAYMVALEKDLSDDELIRRFGIVPGLTVPAPAGSRYEKGTLVVAVTEVETGKTVWRAAMQGFVDLALDSSTRQKRLSHAMPSLFATLPDRD